MWREMNMHWGRSTITRTYLLHSLGTCFMEPTYKCIIPFFRCYRKCTETCLTGACWSAIVNPSPLLCSWNVFRVTSALCSILLVCMVHRCASHAVKVVTDIHGHCTYKQYCTLCRHYTKCVAIVQYREKVSSPHLYTLVHC